MWHHPYNYECSSPSVLFLCTYVLTYIRRYSINVFRIIEKIIWESLRMMKRRYNSILIFSNNSTINDYFSDNNTSDKLVGGKCNYRAYVNRNPSNWLYLGSKFAAWIERLQSERLSILQQHSRGHWLQVRRPTRWILCERTSQVSGKNNNQTPGTRYQRLWKAKFKRELIFCASRCNNYLDASNDTSQENFLTIPCRVI